MIVYASYFLGKHGQYFESSFDLVQKYFCLYIQKREKSIVHIVLHTLQKYIENVTLSDAFSVFGQRTPYTISTV